MQEGEAMLTMQYLPNVVTLKLQADKCNGCRMCVEVCPHAVFVIENKKARIADRDACMECGACAMNCPEGALLVRSGVGCATGIIEGILSGGEPSRGCSGDTTCCG